MFNLQKLLKSIGFYLILIIIVAVIANNYLGKHEKPKELALNSFVSIVKKGNIKGQSSNKVIGQVEIKDRDHYLVGSFLRTRQRFQVNYPERYDIAKLLLDNKVKVKVDLQRQIPWLSIIINVLPFILFFALWMFMIQQMQGGGNKVMSFGKSRHRKTTKDHPRITFKDVAGVDEAVEELEEIKEFLSNPVKFQAIGARIPKGVLLYGPPGSGKTLLAKAVAGEAGVPFFSISGSEFVEMFVGVGASRVRDLFEQAKANSPCIIFMDEIDAVGRHRGAGLGGGHDEREQTLNQLLVEMDGFDMKDNVILLAATNRPDILDPALLRPGRFDRQIVIDRPDILGRKGILKVHTRGKPLAKDVDIGVLARRTPGFTGADLANVVNEAALLTARHGKKQIDMVEMEEAIDRVIAGPERKTRVMSDKEKWITAYHEVGHALVGHLLPNTDPVHKISIIPRGRALGYTLSLPEEDRFNESKSHLVDKLAMTLGGRVAEELIFGDITTGAANDLEQVTKTARRMVCEFGMSDKLGPMTFGQKQHEVFLGKDFAANPDYSPEVAFEIDKEIRRFVEEAHEKATKVLTENRSRLDAIAKVLFEKETIEKEELLELLDKTPNEIVKKAKSVDQKAIGEESGKKKKAKEKKVATKPKLGGLRPAES